MAKMTAAQLDDLMRKVYERRMIRVLYDDPTMPWLPESYWRQDFDAAVSGTTTDLMALIEERRDRIRIRVWEDQQLEKKPVDELLNEMDREVGKLWQPEGNGSWGLMEMRHARGTLKAPTPGRHQPTYSFECYQCGRPITAEGLDHAHRTQCDAALMPADYEAWGHHTPKPWHGEEEDDEDEE